MRGGGEVGRKRGREVEKRGGEEMEEGERNRR